MLSLIFFGAFCATREYLMNYKTNVNDDIIGKLQYPLIIITILFEIFSSEQLNIINNLKIFVVSFA